MKQPTMLRLICSALVLAATPLVAACQSTSLSHEAPWLSGRVVDIDGNPIAAILKIGDAEFTASADGAFAIAPTEALAYRIEIEADGFYPMRHTFSHAELIEAPTLNEIVLIERRPGRTLFVFGGDTMIGRRFYAPFDGEPVLVDTDSRLADSKALLAEMKPYLERADYASINLETPIFEAPPGPAAPKFVTFYSAPETLDALEWAGVDYVALGNNHTYDFLEPGLEITLKNLRESQLDYSGAGTTESEALRAHRQSVASVTYDHLSYVGWPAGPPTQSAETDKGGAALGTSENILSSVRASVEGDGVPILQFHGGLEYVEEPTLSIETKLKQAVDAGAALVIGHHPHVVQGLELYQGKLIAWSLGNFLFDQYFYSAQSAALLYVWMDGDEFHHAEAVPIYIKGYHPTPAVGEMRNAINRRIHDLSAKRGTRLQKSGGHMIVRADQSGDPVAPSFDVAIDIFAGAVRTGHDLLARGSFDAHALFATPDRTWLDLDPRTDVTAPPTRPWDAALTIKLAPGETITTGMRKFQRVFTKGSPMSIRGNIEASSAVRVDVYLQTRADGQGLSEALENGRKTLIGTMEAGPERTSLLDMDFDAPRTRARSIRVLFEIHAAGEDAQIAIDDVQFIEWKTPFVSSLE